MLRLWRDTLRVVIAADSLQLVRTSRWRNRVIEQRVIDNLQTGAEAQSWQPALQALAHAAKGAVWQHTDVRVVLANPLVRFLVAPAQEAGTTQVANPLIANHYFKQAYGEIAVSWACRMDDDGGCVATAIDQTLLDAIVQCFQQPEFRLLSVQPALAVAFNCWRNQFGSGTQWFAMAESGYACVCLLQAGQWGQIRGVAAADDLPAEVLRTVTREQMLAGANEGPAELLLFAQDTAFVQRLETAGCRVRRLTLPAPAGIAIALAA